MKLGRVEVEDWKQTVSQRKVGVVTADVSRKAKLALK